MLGGDELTESGQDDAFYFDDDLPNEWEELDFPDSGNAMEMMDIPKA